jgi:hypothetical protein
MSARRVVVISASFSTGRSAWSRPMKKLAKLAAT